MRYAPHAVPGRDDAAVPLTHVPPGQCGTVVELAGGREFHDCMYSMGVRVGSEVQVVQGGPGAGPLMIAVDDCRFAIGRGMAEKILVSDNGRKTQ